MSEVKNVVVMCGAGISTAAGIPDFRSKGTGLYDNLEKYNLPRPTAMFEISYFRQHPEPFFTLAKELFPGRYKPTAVHHFLVHLDKLGVLRRVFTQNIDTLERIAGLDPEKLVEAHGSFATSRCLYCDKRYSTDDLKDQVMRGQVAKCTESDCDGVVKPDIIFFGEPLPLRYFAYSKEDFAVCDLLIVMGTSLAVHPFNTLIHTVPPSCPRVLINREKVGHMPVAIRLEDSDLSRAGFLFDHHDNTRDVLVLGDIQEQVLRLAELAGWKTDLEQLIEAGEKAFAAIQERNNAEDLVRQALDQLSLSEPSSAEVAVPVEEDLDAPGLLSQGKGFAITPKTDCPHVLMPQHVVTDGLTIVADSACKDCGDRSENWYCLCCHGYYCSRYVNKHMAAHNKSSSHPIGISLSDASVWCFSCDAYIAHPSLTPIEQEVERAKYGTS